MTYLELDVDVVVAVAVRVDPADALAVESDPRVGRGARRYPHSQVFIDALWEAGHRSSVDLMGGGGGGQTRQIVESSQLHTVIIPEPLDVLPMQLPSNNLESMMRCTTVSPSPIRYIYTHTHIGTNTTGTARGN